MRKWVVAGVALALVAIGVGAYLFSQPRQGSVEYHKKEFVKSYNRLGRKGIASLWFLPDRVRGFYSDWQSRRWEFHERALMNAGYLSSASFKVSNALAYNVARAARADLSMNGLDAPLVMLGVSSNDTVVCIAPVDAMERVRQAVDKFDVLELK